MSEWDQFKTAGSERKSKEDSKLSLISAWIFMIVLGGAGGGFAAPLLAAWAFGSRTGRRVGNPESISYEAIVGIVIAGVVIGLIAGGVAGLLIFGKPLLTGKSDEDDS